MGATGIIPPTFFASVDKDRGDSVTLCCGHIVAYSILCVLADGISFDKDHIVLQVTLPTGLFKARECDSSSSNEEIFVEENGTSIKLPVSAVVDLLTSVYPRDSRNRSHLKHLTRYAKHASAISSSKENTLPYRIISKEPQKLLGLLRVSKRTASNKTIGRDKDAMLGKLWTTATQTGKDLSGNAGINHKEIEAASMLVFGTLGFEAYLYASQAITTRQVFTLLLVFGMGLVFFILFLDFRICGISDSANLVIDNLGSVERQVTSVTGLGISSDWKNLPEANFKNLNSRIDTVESMYWAFLTTNNVVLGYVFYRLFAIGVYWPLGVFSGTALFLLFLGVFVYERRAKQGLSKFRGRTRTGGFFLATSIGSLAVVAAYCILYYVSRHRHVLGFCDKITHDHCRGTTATSSSVLERQEPRSEGIGD